jgi:hypothetical protein
MSPASQILVSQAQGLLAMFPICRKGDEHGSQNIKWFNEKSVSGKGVVTRRINRERNTQRFKRIDPQAWQHLPSFGLVR